MRIFDRQTNRGENRNDYGNVGYDRSRNRSREMAFSRSYNNNKTGEQAIVGPGKD